MRESKQQGVQQRSEEQDLLRAVVETAVDGILTIEEDGKILNANPAVLRIFGYTPKELIGKNVRMLMPDPYRTEHDQYLSNYLGTGVKKIIGLGREVQGLRRDGTIFPLDLAVSETTTSRGRIFTGIVRDISERKEYEEALRKERGLLRAVVDHAVDGIITIDERGHIKSANLAVEKIFGYEQEELLGQNVRMLMPEPYHAEHDGYLKNYKSTKVRQIIGIGREVMGRRKDGSVLPIYLGVSETQTEEGTIYTGVLRDITERKKAEAEIKRLNEDLELRVALRTGELQQLVEELEGFSYSIAHDLRQPLRSINAMATIVMEEEGIKLSEDSKQRLESLKLATVRMGNLMDDLLGYAKLGRSQIRRQKIDLSAISINILESLVEPAPEWTVEPNLIIEADAELIAIVMRNLIENSWKYRAADRALGIHVGQSDDGMLFVRDTGVGFDMAFAGKLFKPFQRLHKESEFSGNGIGLANVKRIIEKHEGEVRIESAEGAGTTVFFTLHPNQRSSRKR